MAQEEAKKAVKPKAGKAQAAIKAAAVEAAAEGAPAKKAAAPKKTAAKKEPSGAKLKVTQISGTIARKWDQEATLKGLGLNKRHRSRVLEDTPAVRGMVYKVRHLVKVENA